MSVYRWRRRKTRHFGETWVPFAQVEFAGPDRAFRAFAMQIDSGAVVSVLRRSAADLLGIDADAGRRVELGSVGGAKIAAYVHDLPIRVANWPEWDVPCAIADTEGVPNLLGRAGVFDLLQVDFDASVLETKLSAPWLDSDGQRIWRAILATSTHILDRWGQNPLDPQVDEAARRFVQRGSQLAAAVAGLVKLHRGFECPLMIRAMFDYSAQFEYLMRDPKRRAEQYLEYAHVAKYELIKANLSHPEGIIGESLTNSQLREQGEKLVRKEFERVRDRYARPGKKQRVWDA